MERISLIGMPGSGKTKLGKKLARFLSYSFIDLDAVIVAAAGMPIQQYFEENGEAAFRKIESELLLATFDQHDKVVLSCGGGTPCFYDNMKWIREKSISAYLELPLGVLYQRLMDKDDRPLLANKQQLRLTLENLFMERRLFYEQAHYIINYKPSHWNNLKTTFNYLNNQK